MKNLRVNTKPNEIVNNTILRKISDAYLDKFLLFDRTFLKHLSTPFTRLKPSTPPFASQSLRQLDLNLFFTITEQVVVKNIKTVFKKYSSASTANSKTRVKQLLTNANKVTVRVSVHN